MSERAKIENAKRADRAELALNAYRLAIGEDGPHDLGRVTDLLTDLLHWEHKRHPCDAVCAFEEALATATAHYAYEMADEWVGKEEEVL